MPSADMGAEAAAEGLALVNASGNATALIPGWIKEIAELARNVALITIPFVLWFASRLSEKRRATLDVGRQLDKEISSHLERLFQYRKFEDAGDHGLQESNSNPYKDAPALFLFDSVMVLNFYESICSEIEAGALDEDILYESIRASVVGAAEVVLARYIDRTGPDEKKNYKNLLATSDRWKKRAEPYRQLGSTKIPGN